MFPLTASSGAACCTTVVAVPGWKRNLHCLCVHLSLHERGRRRQLDAIAARLEALADKRLPIIVAGDFNDWRQRASPVLEKSLGMTEVRWTGAGATAALSRACCRCCTWTASTCAASDVLRADVHRGPPWSRLSDHLALSAELDACLILSPATGSRCSATASSIFRRCVAAIDAAQSESSSKPTSSPTTRPAAASPTRWRARRRAACAVHLLIDGFGAKDFAPRFRRMLAEAGVEVLVFRPQVSPGRSGSSAAACGACTASWRCIDGARRLRRRHQHHRRLAYARGIRRRATTTRCASKGRWSRACCDAGRAALARVAWATLGRRWPGFALLRAACAGSHAQPASPGGGQRAALVVRDNFRHRARHRECLSGADRRRALGSDRRQRLFLSRRALPACAAARRRGAASRSRCCCRGKSNIRCCTTPRARCTAALLDAGVASTNITAAYCTPRLRSFDGRVATVGSSNIDPFSLGLAREANVFVDDSAFAAELRLSLHEAIEKEARAVPANYWQRLSHPAEAAHLARLPLRAAGDERLPRRDAALAGPAAQGGAGTSPSLPSSSRPRRAG